MRFCKDCRHAEVLGSLSAVTVFCDHPLVVDDEARALRKGTYFVTGEHTTFASVERLYGKRCGIDAKLFEPRSVVRDCCVPLAGVVAVSAAEWREAFEERAGILEYLANKPRREAEEIAWKVMLESYGPAPEGLTLEVCRK